MERFPVKSKLLNPNIHTGTTPSTRQTYHLRRQSHGGGLLILQPHADAQAAHDVHAARLKMPRGCCDRCPVLLARFNFFSTAHGLTAHYLTHSTEYADTYHFSAKTPCLRVRSVLAAAAFVWSPAVLSFRIVQQIGSQPYDWRRRT